MATAPKLRNIGLKSAAQLRQVGVRTLDDLRALGSLEAFVKLKRAGGHGVGQRRRRLKRAQRTTA
jgi:hypothetical protein